MLSKFEYFLLAVFAALGGCAFVVAATQIWPRDNGDIFLAREDDATLNGTAKGMLRDPDGDYDDLRIAMRSCNASFTTPIDYIVTFNSTGELPDVVDKTAMCYLRCYFEKTGVIDNGKLSAERVRQIIWPATGDSIDYCQMQAKTESNACVRTYAIISCLYIRAIVDARNKPIV